MEGGGEEERGEMNQVLALVPTDELRTRELGNGNRWHAQLTQLITVPTPSGRSRDASVSPHMKAKNRRSARRTWLTPSSSATLFFLQHDAGAVLHVSLKGNVHISCCQGSRLVFASYRDHTDEEDVLHRVEQALDEMGGIYKP